MPANRLVLNHRPKLAITLAVLAGAVLLAGCGSGGANGDGTTTGQGGGTTTGQGGGTTTGQGSGISGTYNLLVSGTIDNTVANSLFVGMNESQAELSLDGNPVGTAKGGQCGYYRGVNTGGFSGYTATGNVWEFCFSNNNVTQIKRICPFPWKPGESSRYKKAGWTADPKDCSH